MLVPRFVLTNTYCTGTCDHCTHNESVRHLAQFEVGCRTTTRTDANNGKLIVAQYNVSVVKKVAHLIRSPFDNIVERMFQGRNERKKQNILKREELDAFVETKEGLLTWCAHVDLQFSASSPTDLNSDASLELFSGEARKLYRDVPCYSEWFRYVQFHNNAIALSRRLPVPYTVVYFEDFVTQLESADKLLDFLEAAANPRRVKQKPVLYPARAGSASLDGSLYRHLFDDKHALSVARFVRSLASPVLWERIRRYFGRELPKLEYDDSSTTATSR